MSTTGWKVRPKRNLEANRDVIAIWESVRAAAAAGILCPEATAVVRSFEEKTGKS